MVLRNNMALRIGENTLFSGAISSKTRDRIRFTLVFTDGAIVSGDLQGNPYRDIAGRELTFKNTNVARTPPLDLPLKELQTGLAGDITAAKKVKVWTTPPSEQSKGSFEWKNSLYLEWYSPENGRVVLEATDLEMTLSDAIWQMTQEEELAAREAAAEAMRSYFDQLCDLTTEQLRNEELTQNRESLNEFEWEETIRFSERLTERYNEALDKFGPDGDGQIDEIMGWQVGESCHLPSFSNDPSPTEQEAPCEPKETEEHPLNREAFAIVEDFFRSTPEDRTNEVTEIRLLLSLVVTKLAGALSCREGGVFTDRGFTIANLKRVLIHIDDALRKTEQLTSERLLKLRQDIIDLQQELRRD